MRFWGWAFVTALTGAVWALIFLALGLAAVVLRGGR